MDKITRRESINSRYKAISKCLIGSISNEHLVKIRENQLGIFMVDTKGDAIITTNVSTNHRNYGHFI